MDIGKDNDGHYRFRSGTIFGMPSQRENSEYQTTETEQIKYSAKDIIKDKNLVLAINTMQGFFVIETSEP